MFTVEERNRIREWLLALAHKDERVVAGAVVGAEAGGRVDRWSDLDLTFGVADGTPVATILDDWSAELTREFRAVHLFDLPVRSTIYRVFLLPGNLQLDLSFTPATEFGASGPDFRLMFGEAIEKPHTPPPSPDYLFGLGVHHAVRARFCIERGRFWQAEYWISGLRDEALTLACLRRGLNPAHGRGFDRLPSEVLGVAASAIVGSLDRAELIRALDAGLDVLLREARATDPRAEVLEPQLRELTALFHHRH